MQCLQSSAAGHGLKEQCINESSKSGKPNTFDLRKVSKHQHSEQLTKDNKLVSARNRASSYLESTTGGRYGLDLSGTSLLTKRFSMIII